ncbi:cysteine hydrolase [Parasulfuritortus cantonensis]|uniref:Cysteine hydrolase n=1 Tax=Parasulfuritortus cantonensis TaxID=2528202 RepID=A0A4R1BMN7_9PROT|nr:cysteine hydrolase [Parasulfuritortus cantonensis]TCJ18578.1 cysteine hydrolase [Parasulfuritortus cantonensis]
MNTALLIIDMQRDFLDPGGYAAAAGLDVAALRRPLPAIRRLLERARRLRLPVVHTREGHRPDLSDCPPAKLARSRAAGAEIGSAGPLGRLLVRGEAGHDIVAELYPRAGEAVVDKPGYGAFHGTALEAILDNQGVERLLIAGVTTEVCVHSTLREATDRGYRCILVGDACGSGHPELHRAALAMVALEGGIFGTVMTTDQVLDLLDKETAA